ncbi:non-canonical purine NTP diphosphatase [Mesonia sp. K7]|uniref:non-canonical purine NTP diphosphatase n=1 Tax=Mesonia sp. K7 TaxID=2218606 RepID=UPI000DA88FA4|nr:non-canonical purine NTP diphosphatase [Mesonia sp. K7]PZD76938.1 non-canonical purine NTP pyrophosphatase [Mesonia sp. K7]
MKLVFATHNLNKLKEIKSLLPANFEVMSLEDINCHEDIAETENTIEGNALLKANYIKENYGYDCFADDSGLEIDALNGEPGVYSARYAGEPKNDQANIDKVLQKLANERNTRANFKTVIAYVTNKEQQLFTGICEGNIIKNQKGENGFGYDPIFVPEGENKTFAEMTLEEKNQFSHRKKAFAKFLNHFKK